MSLGNLDTVIAFCAVMLLLSLPVTALVQGILACVNLRGWHLKAALERLLRQAGSPLDPPAAAQVARAAVKHPAVAHNFHRATTALSLAELNVLLDDLAAAGSPLLSPAVRGALREWLGRPAVRRGLAEWFEVIMRRATERYAGLARGLTAVLGTAGAVWLRVDAVQIYNQLAMHQPLRLSAGAGPGHWTGVLLTALLLSLGAPFWYNLLHRAASLRPLLAEVTAATVPPEPAPAAPPVHRAQRPSRP